MAHTPPLSPEALLLAWLRCWILQTELCSCRVETRRLRSPRPPVDRPPTTFPTDVTARLRGVASGFWCCPARVLNPLIVLRYSISPLPPFAPREAFLVRSGIGGPNLCFLEEAKPSVTAGSLHFRGFYEHTKGGGPPGWLEQ